MYRGPRNHNSHFNPHQQYDNDKHYVSQTNTGADMKYVKLADIPFVEDNYKMSNTDAYGIRGVFLTLSLFDTNSRSTKTKAELIITAFPSEDEFNTNGLQFGMSIQYVGFPANISYGSISKLYDMRAYIEDTGIKDFRGFRKTILHLYGSVEAYGNLSITPEDVTLRIPKQNNALLKNDDRYIPFDSSRTDSERLDYLMQNVPNEQLVTLDQMLADNSTYAEYQANQIQTPYSLALPSLANNTDIDLMTPAYHTDTKVSTSNYEQKWAINGIMIKNAPISLSAYNGFITTTISTNLEIMELDIIESSAVSKYVRFYNYSKKTWSSWQKK